MIISTWSARSAAESALNAGGSAALDEGASDVDGGSELGGSAELAVPDDGSTPDVPPALDDGGTALDEAGSDVEALLQGNVLTLDCESGGQVIVNRHVPNAEIWLAGKAGGFHFRLADDGRWVDTRDGGELFARLAELIQAQAGETIAF